MNTRTKKLSTLCAALGGAGLARTGAMLALALGAAQAGAATYTVPLQFNITLTPPVCTLAVGPTTTVTNDPITAPTTGDTVITDLTPAAYPVAVSNTPNGILGALSTTLLSNHFTGDSAGVHGTSGYTVQRRILPAAMPAVVATCTTGTPMTARIARAGGSVNSTGANGLVTSGFTLGTKGTGSQTATNLPIGMLMGIVSFDGTAGTTGVNGTTSASQTPTVTKTANGSAQPLTLAGVLYANDGATMFTSTGYAGQWTYTYNLTLAF